MRKYTALLVLLLLTALNSAAAGEKTLKFEWRQKISSDFGGWKLYMSETSQTYTNEPILLIPFQAEALEYTSTTVITSPDDEERTYYFVLT
ncbi:MAG TPA: hypothetical protein EYP19_15080, partial [Desulfobacterales bacterium]|nr:hypothetical protein [Desulfobacterales bacterium]